MRYAVAVPKITSNLKSNIGKMLSMMSKASLEGTDIILFPELVLSGFHFSDSYEIDKQNAHSISSVFVQTIVENAKKYKIWTAFGFLELFGRTIYDSALLVDNTGKIQLHYRRISLGWRANNANPQEYGCGKRVTNAITPFGKTAFLICGDLFDELAFSQSVDAKLDLLLFPFTRGFSRKMTDTQKWWDRVEMPDYTSRFKQIGALVLMSNYIDEGSFGGGYIIDGDGGIIKAKPLNEEGLLIWDTF